jgi:hypothetical protein
MKIKFFYLMVFLSLSFTLKASDEVSCTIFKTNVIKDLGTVCSGSTSVSIGGIIINVSIAYQTSSASCEPPSYCSSGASDAYMVAWIPIAGGADWEYETPNPTNGAYNAVFGPCFFAKTLETSTK